MRHEDVGFDAGSGGIGGESAGCVTGGGDRQFFQAVVASHGDGECESACFEGAGGIGAFFFEKNSGMAAAAKHRRPAFSERDGINGGENGAVTPHAGPGRSRGLGYSGVAGGRTVERTKIVTNVQRALAFGAESLRAFGGESGITARAFEIFDGWHRCHLSRWVGRSTRFAGRLDD